MTKCRALGQRLNDIEGSITAIISDPVTAEEVGVSGDLGPTLRDFLDSKGEPGGFAPLNDDGIVSRDYLPRDTFFLSAKVEASGFSGNPKKHTVIFTSPFLDDDYTVTVIGGDARAWTYEDLAPSGFVINSGANADLTSPVHWRAAEVFIP